MDLDGQIEILACVGEKVNIVSIDLKISPPETGFHILTHIILHYLLLNVN